MIDYFLQAMSQLFHLGERMDEQASLKADLAELTSQLREEKNNVLAKEKEIKALKFKMRLVHWLQRRTCT